MSGVLYRKQAIYLRKIVIKLVLPTLLMSSKVFALSTFVENLPKVIPCQSLPLSKTKEWPEKYRELSSWDEDTRTPKVYIFDGFDSRPGAPVQDYFVTYQVSYVLVNLDNASAAKFPWKVYVDDLEAGEKKAEAPIYDGPFRTGVALDEDGLQDLTRTTVIWEQCVLRELYTIPKNTQGVVNSPETIYKSIAEDYTVASNLALAKAAEASVLFIRDMTPILGTIAQVGKCRSNGSFSCWLDAGVSAAGDAALFLMFPVKAAPFLQKVGVSLNTAVGVVRVSQASVALWNEEYMKAMMYGIDSVIRFSVTYAAKKYDIAAQLKPEPTCSVPSKVKVSPTNAVPNEPLMRATAEQCSACNAAAEVDATLMARAEKAVNNVPLDPTGMRNIRRAINAAKLEDPTLRTPLMKWAASIDISNATAKQNIITALAMELKEFEDFLKVQPAFQNFEASLEAYITQWCAVRNYRPVDIESSLSRIAFRDAFAPGSTNKLGILRADRHFQGQCSVPGGDTHTTYAHFMQLAVARRVLGKSDFEKVLLGYVKGLDGIFTVRYGSLSLPGEGYNNTWGMLLDGLEVSGLSQANNGGSRLTCAFQDLFNAKKK